MHFYKDEHCTHTVTHRHTILRVDGELHCGEAVDADLQAFLQEHARPPAQRSIGDTFKESKSTESLTHSQGSSLSDLSMGSPQLRRGVVADPAADTQDEAKETPAKKEHSKRSFGNTVRRALGHAAARRASSFTSVEAFTKRQNGSVDVWWLYDDGGLTLLLPYILSTRRAWASCPLRVFTLTNKNTEMEIEERNMASLLSKFRIDYSALKMIPDITRRPKDSTLAYFNKLVQPFMTTEDNADTTGITEADLLSAQDRTHRHLRLRELIAQCSRNARLVCVTLPMPRRRAVVSPPLYLCWLHAIASAAPRVLLLRGNHTPVLTFYS
ncbi:hypothetical protein JYU34_016140 [Plutella xylostella]|uniref:SLC12A transporter C-terminal domain-containing protein n=1 Tax=Plutella xylostella TaxID=51655 RepID=A0ABQ7Q6W9_PLUXY|nr:hypothetical protein JYU34_016140 [Plutella xylostella]